MSHLNVEIKAVCGDHDRIRSILLDRGADFRGADRQKDTYFKCARGRLKLREGNIENSLIHYMRENSSGPKDSNVVLYHPEPGPSLRELLSAALGVLVTVEKVREIYFIDNVKFHIDTVPYLGKFVEIEAIDETGNIGREKLLEQCREYIGLLGISDGDMIDRSYSDMLLEKGRKAPG